MKKALILISLLSLSLAATDDFDIDPTDMPEDLLTRAPHAPKQSIIKKRKSKNATAERTVAPNKLTATINNLFDQQLKANNLNPACVEQYMKKDLIKAKRALEEKLNEKLNASYRSEHVFKDVETLVQEFFKTFITRVHIVLSQAWVLSIIDDNKQQTATLKPNSGIVYSKKTNDLYNQLTVKRAKKGK